VQIISKQFNLAMNVLKIKNTQEKIKTFEESGGIVISVPKQLDTNFFHFGCGSVPKSYRLSDKYANEVIMSWQY
jgi:hypothetical protein